MNKYQMAIEITSFQINIIISETTITNEYNIIGFSSVKTKSFENDIIINEENFFLDFFKAYNEVLKSSGLEFTYLIPINLILNFKNNKVFKNTIKKTVNNHINEELISNIKYENKNYPYLKKEYELLKTIELKYFIDKHETKEYLYKKCNTFSIDFLNIFVNSNNLEIIKNTIKKLNQNIIINKIDIDASTLPFSFEEKIYRQNYSIVNIKNNFIDLNLYENNILINKYTILSGNKNIIKDLQILLNIDEKEAINISKKYLFKIFDEKSENEINTIKIVNVKENIFEEVEISYIKEIIKTRIYEFLLLINRIIIDNYLFEYTDNGIYLLNNEDYLNSNLFLIETSKKDDIIKKLNYQFKFDLKIKNEFKNLFIFEQNKLSYVSLLGSLINENNNLNNNDNLLDLKNINEKKELLEDIFEFKQKNTFTKTIKNSTLNYSKKYFVIPYRKSIKWLGNLF